MAKKWAENSEIGKKGFQFKQEEPLSPSITKELPISPRKEEGTTLKPISSIMIPKEINLAERIAISGHAGQTDQAGKDYIEHPRRVARHAYTLWQTLAPNLDYSIIKDVAMLHDVLEDCHEWTAERLLTEGVRPEVVALVQVLSHQENEPRSQYIDKIISAGPLAILVKLADLTDNTDPERMKILSLDKQERLTKKYAIDIVKIKDALEASNI
jgi:(p)ppGpp synthase/HD superfamily hydrolase